MASIHPYTQVLSTRLNKFLWTFSIISSSMDHISILCLNLPSSERTFIKFSFTISPKEKIQRIKIRGSCQCIRPYRPGVPTHPTSRKVLIHVIRHDSSVVRPSIAYWNTILFPIMALLPKILVDFFLKIRGMSRQLKYLAEQLDLVSKSS